ncbi:MAG TPA: GntR family transcriptional regulator [Dongiaceae bacterium]|jgi:DNA-binding GntR family transcriptional regulator|nr:GntR family transcriptional regulator [Dongiaceae bacterium]
MVAERKSKRKKGGEAAVLEGGVGGWAMPPIQTKEQQVAEILREKIFAGVFRRGQKLKQAEIAKMLDISITPVRAALKLLEAQGYVRVTAHRGAVVAPFQISEVDELFSLRVDLEAKLTLAAAKRATPTDVRMLSVLNDDLGRAIDRDSRELVRSSNFRFHFRLYELANLPQTLEFVRILWAKYPFDLLGSIPRVPEYATTEHAEIIAALERKDARAAMRAMQSHIELGHQAFKAAYSLSGRDAA